ncbi:MAG TPA: D-aminoacylase [Thermoanaerobaculia bacterium]|nr:D-aminoacylase [Thermoanaerobaculia bacterium]
MTKTVLLLFTALACGEARSSLPARGSSATASIGEAAPAEARAADFDIAIRNGIVIDGTGAPRVRGDVGIKGDTIVVVGDLAGRTAKTTIDATGQIVAPGLIDLLGVSEGAVLIDPSLESKVRQGVTTEVTGEGRSPGPIDDAMAAEMNRTRPAGFPEVRWRSLAEYMTFLESRGTAINFAFYVGATNPREIVLGRNDRDPNAEEMRRMESIVDQAMRDGAVGLSTALIYVPAVYAETGELIRLAKVVARHGGSYFTHMRNEADTINSALDEAFRIAREGGMPLNIFHLKIGGRKNWGRMPAVVAKIEREKARGLDIAANVYPYTATSTGLTAIVPAWALEGGYDQFLERLSKQDVRARIASEIATSGFYSRIGGAEGILVRRIPNPAFQQYERKRLNEIAALMTENEKKTISPAEAALRLFEAGNATPIAIYFSMSEGDVRVALSQKWVSLGSDSGAVVGEMKKSGAHPRAFGTFSRVLGHYVRDEKLFTLEEAVRKMTSLAASRVAIKDRGTLKEGMKADIVIFDAAKVRDLSTYEDPHRYSEGVSNVVVNGTPIILSGRLTGKLPGRVLRGKGYRGK